jgi:hypothetical protein
MDWAQAMSLWSRRKQPEKLMQQSTQPSCTFESPPFLMAVYHENVTKEAVKITSIS